MSGGGSKYTDTPLVAPIHRVLLIVVNGGLTVLQSGLKSKHFRYISHDSEHREIHVIISIKQQVHSFKSLHMKSYVKRYCL